MLLASHYSALDLWALCCDWLRPTTQIKQRLQACGISHLPLHILFTAVRTLEQTVDFRNEHANREALECAACTAQP